MLTVRYGPGVFTSSPSGGRRSSLRWIASEEEVAYFLLTPQLVWGQRDPASCCVCYFLVVVMALFSQFTQDQIMAKPDINEDLRTMLPQAEVDLAVVDNFRALRVRSLGMFLALADFGDLLVDLCGIDKTKGALHRLGKTRAGQEANGDPFCLMELGEPEVSRAAPR